VTPLTADICNHAWWIQCVVDSVAASLRMELLNGNLIEERQNLKV
jgi:hypothetical protein